MAVTLPVREGAGHTSVRTALTRSIVRSHRRIAYQLGNSLAVKCRTARPEMRAALAQTKVWIWRKPLARVQVLGSMKVLGSMVSMKKMPSTARCQAVDIGL